MSNAMFFGAGAILFVNGAIGEFYTERKLPVALFRLMWCTGLLLMAGSVIWPIPTVQSI